MRLRLRLSNSNCNWKSNRNGNGAGRHLTFGLDDGATERPGKLSDRHCEAIECADLSVEARRAKSEGIPAPLATPEPDSHTAVENAGKILDPRSREPQVL